MTCECAADDMDERGLCLHKSAPGPAGTPDKQQVHTCYPLAGAGLQALLHVGGLKLVLRGWRGSRARTPANPGQRSTFACGVQKTAGVVTSLTASYSDLVPLQGLSHRPWRHSRCTYSRLAPHLHVLHAGMEGAEPATAVEAVTAKALPPWLRAKQAAQQAAAQATSAAPAPSDGAADAAASGTAEDAGIQVSMAASVLFFEMWTHSKDLT